MILETKYNRGQKVFVECGAKLEPATIKDIDVKVKKEDNSDKVKILISYGLYIGNGQSASSEQWIHSSPEEYQLVLVERKQQKVLQLQEEIDKLTKAIS